MRFLERFWFGCGHCHDGKGCPLAEHVDPQTGEFHTRADGLPIPVAVILVFIVPLVTAIVAAHLAGQWNTKLSGTALGWWQCGGGVAGFFVGVALARAALWFLRRFASANGGAE